MQRTLLIGLSAAVIALANGAAVAAGQYDPGVTDTEIKIGNTNAYSGPASAYGTIGKSEAAYFAMINDQGGINGRKINFISRDDGYSPPKTVEVVRQLVEQDHVLLLFQTLGTPPNIAISGLSERQQGTATVCGYRCQQVERPKALPLDDWVATQLSSRGADLCSLHPQKSSRR